MFNFNATLMEFFLLLYIPKGGVNLVTTRTVLVYEGSILCTYVVVKRMLHLIPTLSFYSYSWPQTI